MFSLRCPRHFHYDPERHSHHTHGGVVLDLHNALHVLWHVSRGKLLRSEQAGFGIIP